jgi:ribonuclease P protein subunit POP4
MIITSDIIRQEFIGRQATVVRSPVSSYLGMAGPVVDETRNTLTLLHEGGNKIIIKELSVFNFQFSDGTIVEIDGKLLVGKPEDRLKKTVKRLW